MATFLDISGLSSFSSFFAFAFVWLATYAILKYTKVLGDNEAINIVLGLFIGLFALFSPLATGIITYVAPWFAVVLIFAVFGIMAMKMFGGSFESLGSLRILTFVVIVLIIVVSALSYVRQNISIPGDNETTADYNKGVNVLFHPKILGVIFIMVIAIFTVVLLAGKPL